MSSIARLPSATLSDQQTQMIYNWIDTIPLSRPKRNIARDFSDGVLLAEVVSHFHPGIVELHNYANANSLTQKIYNWETLNFKVLKRLGFQLHAQDMEDCCNILFKVKKFLNKPLMSPRRPSSTVNSAASGVKPPECSSPRPLSVGELTKLVQEQDVALSEMRRKIEILTEKNSKLEQLVKIKDKKLEVLLQSK